MKEKQKQVSGRGFKNTSNAACEQQRPHSNQLSDIKEPEDGQYNPAAT